MGLEAVDINNLSEGRGPSSEAQDATGSMAFSNLIYSLALLQGEAGERGYFVHGVTKSQT